MKPLAMEPEVEEQILEDIMGFMNDPLGYVLYAFPWGEPGTELADQEGPYEWQRDLLESVGERLRAGMSLEDVMLYVGEVIQEAVASGHGIGKSAMVAWLTLWGLSTFEDTKGVVTANTDTQLRTKTWPEVAKWHRLAINTHWFKWTATALHSVDPKHETNWRIDCIPWSVHNTEAFAGLHNKGKRLLLIFDEASAIDDKVWEVSEGALTDENTQILWFAFGNPTRATGRFRECYRKFRHRWSEGKARNIDSRTVEGTNKEQIAKWVEDYGEDSDFVKVRVRGLFPSQSLKQFISEVDVDKGYGKHLRKEQYDFAPKILTLDNAWEGDDEMVIGLRQGLLFSILRTAPKNDNDIAVANILANLEDEHQADAVFIDGGYGTGVVSAGRTLKRNWRLVWFSEASADAGCLNKRAEMYKLGRDWLKEGGVLPADSQLREEITSVETVPRMDGKIQLESKKDMKARNVPSPGRADAWVLSFAHPVRARASASHDRVYRARDRAKTETRLYSLMPRK